VGKSTLLNRLLGTKLSIVSAKPSTTRHRVLGILSADAAEGPDGHPPYQIVFVDTPGVVRPRYRLHDHMMADVDRALGDADVVVLLADATEKTPTHDARNAVERLATVQAPVILALNKNDLIRNEEALPLVAQYAALRAPDAPLEDAFAEVIPLSAQTGFNVDVLMEAIVQRLPLGPPYYPKDQLSEHPERFFIGEIVREAVFNRYRDEIPYSTQVNVVLYEERPGGEIKSLTRRINDTATLSVTRPDGVFSANIVENPLETGEHALRGTIATSLYEAVNAAGGTNRLAVELAHVFQYDIDFVNQARPGDSFIVAYEQQFQDGEFVRDGDILAAEFVNAGKTYRAVRYVGPNGKADYYTPDGRPVRKAFLRYPVDYARISSGFSLARRHPVLNRVRAHKGIDFAASTGTPIKAAGAGRIVSRGRNGGYGNVVVVDHGKGITTLYGHMSRFAKGQGVGTRVSQGQVIGYVGMTGLASGPHVHYEYRVNGVHKNPARVTVPKADPIPASLMADFRTQTTPLLARLEAQAAPAVQVASAPKNAGARAGR
jgi:GTP-binding protein Era